MGLKGACFLLAVGVYTFMGSSAQVWGTMGSQIAHGSCVHINSPTILLFTIRLTKHKLDVSPVS